MQNILVRGISSHPSLQAFLTHLEGNNASPDTQKAYRTDIGQFFAFVEASNDSAERPDQIERVDIEEYLAAIGRDGRAGVTRARKLAAIRAYFYFLVDTGVVATSPAARIPTPKKESRHQVWLRPEEYNQLLSLAGGHPRDYAILQVFLQTGLRVSELANLALEDINLVARTLTVMQGKGMQARTLDLEKKAAQALKNYLQHRPDLFDEHLFLNKHGQALSVRGIRRIVDKYAEAAALHKHVSPHALRRTFATAKGRRGVPTRQIQDWLGHRDIRTTQGYVSLVQEDGKRMMEATSL